MKVALALLLTAMFTQADALSDAYDALKRAEAARDGVAILQHARDTSRLAREAIAQQKPPEARNDYEKDRAIYLEQTDTYTEYSMGVAASYAHNSTATIEQLVAQIIEQNPKSLYLALAVPPYLAALSKEGPARHEEGIARILKVQPENEDAVLAQADALLTKEQFTETLHIATQLLTSLATKTRPAAYSEQYWSDKRALTTNRAHYLAGIAACRTDQWSDCDTHLRQANPDAALAPTVNLYLGLANFNLGRASSDRARLTEALEFTRQAAAVAGPVQQAAQQNLAAIEQALRQ